MALVRPNVMRCTNCGYIEAAGVADMASGVDPVTALLFRTLRPESIPTLQERVTQQADQLANNLKGLLAVSESLKSIDESLREIPKLNDTFKEVRNTLADTNQRIKELSEKL